ncbi:predicted protein [Sclerotinia sclerotiorum 1980 UF-70]|uniref:Uncharacterized protein n=1 Tax=Sclerotinia sclerotiorum (strain ATCC 18683 / 1980 / Ss-1) TaxID=665079 RepID=A7ENG8_SCLS1|nr:predicted protein [Sclerotinia sclerotiorum 1980 UF-70]EDO04384.1 predicted protein [Sclerotinia sclerotiorum 1980 UF-70]
MASTQYMGQKNPETYLSSTPADVRKYLTALLVQNHGISIEEAKEVAACWIYGRGSEFYQYDLETFKNLFGNEIGMLFYLYSRGITPGGKLYGIWRFLGACCVQ